VRIEDVPPVDEPEVGPEPPEVEVAPSHEAQVGTMTVRRALPRRARRTVGAWCFADHMGPAPVTAETAPEIGPHPHIGLQTVTWLVAGEMLHRDSLGSEQTIVPGQLNLMTAGRGVAHAEESTGRYRGDMHGIQLWVAQPEATRHGDPAFEHHAELPRMDLDDAVVTVLVGSLEGTASPARRDTDHVGLDVALRPGSVTLPVAAGHEHALVVLDGAVAVGAEVVTPGHLAYLGIGRHELVLTARDDTRLLVLGGLPFESPILMWWNFVARSRDEVDEARAAWQDDTGRFGDTGSALARIDAPTPPWASGSPPRGGSAASR
jgi:quercetin 2,3-dioxygenase